MSKRLGRLMLLLSSTVLLLGLLTVGANAANYPYGKMTFSEMPSNWQDVTVEVGDVTMPLSKFPVGHYSNDSEVGYLTYAEMNEYGIENAYSPIWTRGTTCVGFARHVYAALFYKYPQNATVDTALGTSYGGSYYYYDVIKEIYGTSSLAGGYSAATLKELFSYCRPGAVFSADWHTMVIMAIYDDGFLIYDCNFSDHYQVDVRRYTWQGFVNSMGSRGIQGLHMPKYYPGFRYSMGSGRVEVQLDTSTAGHYVVDHVSSYVNVRSGPGTGHEKLGTLDLGEEVDVLGTYDDWAQIRYNNETAWVYAEYLEPKPIEVRVTFDGNGATPSFTSRTYESGELFGTMPTAEKANRTLLGWSDGKNLYDSGSRVPDVSSLALKASWCVYTFRDVRETDWFAEYVEQGRNYGLISRDTYFNPGSTATRGQFVTVMGREYEREAGIALHEGSGWSFWDVNAGTYYARYVRWGSEHGIVNGYSSSEFAPNDGVTREQAATLLYRFAVASGVIRAQSLDESQFRRFVDGDSISDYAKIPMCWAVKAGIFQGDDQGKMNPQDVLSRGEMVTIFTRYINYYNNTPKAVQAGTLLTLNEAGEPVEEVQEPQPEVSPAPTPETTPAPSAQPVPEAAPEATPEPSPEVSLEPTPEGAQGGTVTPDGAPIPEETPEVSQQDEAEETEIPDAPEGMVNVILELDGGKLPEQQENMETVEIAQLELTAEPEPVPEWKQYGKQYVLVCKIGTQLKALPAAEQEGMQFLGWFLEDREFDLETELAEKPLVLTARWAPLKAAE